MNYWAAGSCRSGLESPVEARRSIELQPPALKPCLKKKKKPALKPYKAIQEFIARYLTEIELIRKPATEQIGRQGRINNQRPKAPPQGYAKIHVDAACRRGEGGAAAVVCRDAARVFLGSSALVAGGVDDPFISETIACREALALAQDLSLHAVIVASDAKEVMGAINGCAANPMEPLFRR